jgi:ATP-dependent helicase/nuclease subunit B
MFLSRFFVPSKPLLSPLGSLLAWRGTVDRLFAESADNVTQSHFNSVSKSASDLACRVARVLGGVSLEKLELAESPGEVAAPPISNSLRRAIARRLARLDRELASSMSSCRDVSKAADGALARGDVSTRIAEAWSMLAEVEAFHEHALRRAGVIDRDRAVYEALRQEGERKKEIAGNSGSVVGVSASAHATPSVIDGGFERIVVLFADPEPVQRSLLDALEALGVRIDVCVHTQDDIDSSGFPQHEAWAARAFSTDLLAHDSILVSQTVGDAGDAVVEAVRALPLGRTAESITVMAADEDLERSIDRALQMAGSSAQTSGGHEFSSSRLGTLLARLETLLREGTMEALAAWVRHPDVAAKLGALRPSGCDPSTDFGEVIAKYWAATAATRWQDDVATRAEGAPAFRALQTVFREALASLLSPSVAIADKSADRTAEETADGATEERHDQSSARVRVLAKSLRAIVKQWSEITESLDATNSEVVPDERAFRAVRVFDRALSDLHDFPRGLADSVEAADVIGILRESLDRQVVDRAVATGSDGVELVRWLDVGIADEPHLILCGMCEGAVPDGAIGEILLPEQLRRAANLPTAQRRVARDAWILDGLLARTARRQGATLRVIVPRKAMDGEPLRPSRFLLRVGAQELPDRVAQFFGEERAIPARREQVAAMQPDSDEGAHGSQAALSMTSQSSTSQSSTSQSSTSQSDASREYENSPPEIIALLPEIKGTQLTQISVTAFRQYLRCPYLFQLRQDPRLRLSDSKDGASELGGDGFGSLLHAALEAWGREEAALPAPTTDRAQLEAALSRALDQVVAERFAKSSAPAVRVQIELVRRRLRRFAAIQQEQAEAGWHVRAVEVKFHPPAREPSAKKQQPWEFPAPCFPDANGIYLTGQIDRIDRHIKTGAWRALDYKSGQSGDSPTEAHKDGDERDGRLPDGDWLDLQLPLYRTLLKSLSSSAFGGPVLVAPTELGYVNLTPKVESSAFEFLRADDQDLLEAEEEAARIIALIQAGAFEPAEEVPVYRGDPLGVIWGEGLRRVSSEERAESIAGGAE